MRTIRTAVNSRRMFSRCLMCSHNPYNSVNPVRFSNRIMNDSDAAHAEKGVCCLLGKTTVHCQGHMGRPSYMGLLDGNLKNTLEYQWAEVSPVSSHLWPLSRLTLYEGVSWGCLWNWDPDFNQLSHWIDVHREGDRKPRGIQRYIRFWHKSYVTWQKSSVRERYWEGIFQQTPNLAPVYFQLGVF